MKIGILTFHSAINYGAVLQAYGLQEYLKSLGHEVYIIDYRPQYLKDPYQLFQWKFKVEDSFMSNLKSLIRESLVMPIRIVRKSKFQQFINQYLNIYSWKDNLNVFDAFIFGSDQIWNPKITKGLDDIFLGKFKEAKGKKLIAYAASVGAVQNLSQNEFEKLTFYLNGFNRIGLREKTLYEKISKVNCNVFITIDPVLLAGKDIFQKIAVDVKNERPYLLLFTLGRDEYAVKEAYKIAEQKSLDVIEIISSKESLYNRNIKQMLSPTEFLGYVKMAAYVVTSSFHGTVFSILFHKNFNVIGSDKIHGERIIQLLNSIGLLNRFKMYNESEILDVAEVKYDECDLRLFELVSLSRDFFQCK